MNATKPGKWRRGIVRNGTPPKTGLIRGNIGIVRYGLPRLPSYCLIHIPSGLVIADRDKLAEAKALADWIETESDPKLLDELADGSADYSDPRHLALCKMCRIRD